MYAPKLLASGAEMLRPPTLTWLPLALVPSEPYGLAPLPQLAGSNPFGGARLALDVPAELDINFCSVDARGRPPPPPPPPPNEPVEADVGRSGGLVATEEASEFWKTGEERLDRWVK